MNKKSLLVLFVILSLTVSAGAYFWEQFKVERSRRADEVAVRSVVENFGHALKNVSLLSPTVAEDIEENYKDFLDPILFEQWKEDPSKAVGRLTSSPWPDRIEISDILKFGLGAYDVMGNIVEITSVEQTEGGFVSKRAIELGVVKFDDRWLITGVSLGEYMNNYVADQLRDCLPKSDMASHEKCQALLASIKNFDECVMAGFPILKSNPPQCAILDGITFTQETNSTWEMAVLAINNCEVEEAWQLHSKIVTLKLKNGNKLIVSEPKIDEIIRIIEEVEDVCGSVVIGTE